MTAVEDLSFPPLLRGELATGDAIRHACLRAAEGCDAGLVCYRLAMDELQAALVFAPEVPLAQAMAMLPLCGVGFQNALGALAPPEIAVHLDWDGGIRINGASCGRFRAISPGTDPRAVPDWLVIGFTLPLIPATDRPGDTPDRTWLYVEGCADLSPAALLEAWARHCLNWIARWEDEGNRPLHADWEALAHGLGEQTSQSGHHGVFVGIDADFGMLLRDGDSTHLIPLTDLLEAAP
ncbi:biotin/lipoate--protein ligase family protein [Paracoccus methylarcula]|uniref:DUF4444 domain-containing protein n=1 Tax=Paracoccus methylarcula TaxID=72022 RepID=A0A422QX61_9RHOB|nr:biotin/lipoate--protein ligase family protein [Paracoccus methylarcula]RNF34582.1 DUF4444 domain-containing protein [Paracoccus methylarcula]